MKKIKNNQAVIRFAIIMSLVFISSFSEASPKVKDKGSAYTLFPFDNGVGRGSWTPEQQAKTIKELGYKGIGYNYTNVGELKERLKAMDAHGLRIYSLYVVTKVGAADTLPEDLDDAMQLIEGRDIIIWINMIGPKGAAKGTLDNEAVKIVRKVSLMAKKYGLRVALYGHKNLYIETTEDGLSILQKASCKNVYVSLNLCHELMYGNAGRLDEIIRKCAKRLVLVSVNGADVGNKKYILRLDQGNFDLAGLIRALNKNGYKGPVGLQCYNVPGDIKENLKINIAAWKEVMSKL